MKRLMLAFRAFFAVVSGAPLPAELIPPPPPEKPVEKASDGALQLLAILQRDARLVDFLMEDIAGYDDEQVGAAVRNVHQQARQSLSRYVRLAPVIDAVEGTPASVSDASQVKFLGNVPARGQPSGGVLRHKGWRAEKVDFPKVTPGQDYTLIAPAEVEVE